MTDMGFPARVWPDMCAVYRDPTLSAACRSLQEAFGVDVPLLLVLSLADRAGYGLSAAAVSELAQGAAAWREAVILPLRQARQAMKLRFTAPAEKVLREDIKRAELEAEHLPPASGTEQAARHYLKASGLTDDAADEFIDTFAAACAAQIARTDHE